MREGAGYLKAIIAHLCVESLVFSIMCLSLLYICVNLCIFLKVFKYFEEFYTFVHLRCIKTCFGWGVGVKPWFNLLRPKPDNPA